MKIYTSLFGIVSAVLMTSCASVGGAWQAGTEIVTGTVDSVVGGAATMTKAVTDDVMSVADVAVKTTQGVVEVVAEEVDSQTDELQPKEEEKKD
jgi:hypothetical protein